MYKIKSFCLSVLLKVLDRGKQNVKFIDTDVNIHNTSIDGYFKLYLTPSPSIKYIPLYYTKRNVNPSTIRVTSIKSSIADCNMLVNIDNHTSTPSNSTGTIKITNSDKSSILSAILKSNNEDSLFTKHYPRGIDITYIVQVIHHHQSQSNSNNVFKNITFKHLLQLTNISHLINEYNNHHRSHSQTKHLVIAILYDETFEILSRNIDENIS